MRANTCKYTMEATLCVRILTLLLAMTLTSRVSDAYVHGGWSPRLVALATFNTGLTPRVENYASRAKSIPQKLAENRPNADVMCLQEVWFSQDMERILDATAHTFPYSYSYLHEDVSKMTSITELDAPCFTEAFAFTFWPCIEEKCGALQGQSGDQLLTCATKQCGLMTSLGQECISCLVMFAGSDDFLQTCVQAPRRKVNVPGLLLLSKLPLSDVSMTRYAPNVKLLLPRAYLSAQIKGVGTVACTHTTANLGPVYFEALRPRYTSWSGQNLDETRALVRALDHVTHAVVMGDLNSSPAVPKTGISADMEGSFEYFSNHGYLSPYTDDVGICTWCKYNKNAHAQSYLILDHILLKNITSIAAMRIFDENIEGEEFPPSDHYGIMVLARKTED